MGRAWHGIRKRELEMRKGNEDGPGAERFRLDLYEQRLQTKAGKKSKVEIGRENKG